MKMKRVWLGMCCLVLLSCAGCGTLAPRQGDRGLGTSADKSVVGETALLPTKDEEFDRKIAPADTIIIDVFGEKEDLKMLERRVQASGTITYPLLGEVEVAGKTTAEVAMQLRDQLIKGHYLKNPEVSVNVKEYRQRTVTVLGEVTKAGTVKLPAEYRMDILEAIGEAGGFSPKASKTRIELNRRGKKQRFNFHDLRNETDRDKKVWLEPGDVIYVPESVI